MSLIVQSDSTSVNSDASIEFPVDLVSEDDRRWWDEVTRSEFWADLATDSVADLYGTPDEDDRDEAEVDYYFRSRPHDRPSDEDQPHYRYLGGGGYIDQI